MVRVCDGLRESESEPESTHGELGLMQLNSLASPRPIYGLEHVDSRVARGGWACEGGGLLTPSIVKTHGPSLQVPFRLSLIHI